MHKGVGEVRFVLCMFLFVSVFLSFIPKRLSATNNKAFK